MKRILPVFLLIVSILLLGGCAKSSEQKETSPREEVPLIVGMMGAVDAAPFYHALQAGYFEKEGAKVELVLFTNGQHRQTALQTRQVDGAMTDLVALITQSTSDFRLKGTLSTDGRFPLLAKASLDGKKTLSAGTMEISVTNYLLEQYLGKNHILDKVYINEIPARLEAVASGELDTGIFPEPFASIGALRGLDKIIYEDIPSESLNIIAFTEEAIKNKRSQIEAFHSAYARAVADIVQNPDIARDVLLEVIPNLPQTVRDTMDIPPYHKPRLPSDTFTSEIIDWTGHITGSSYEVGPEDLYDTSFIRDL